MAPESLDVNFLIARGRAPCDEETMGLGEDAQRLSSTWRLGLGGWGEVRIEPFCKLQYVPYLE